MAERWVPVVGFEGYYEVSDLGRVRSLDRVLIRSTGTKYTARGIMKAISPGDPYPIVGLKRPGKKVVARLHVVVMDAFVGPRPTGMDVCHGDGNVNNNALSNLRYDTRASNHADKKLHGTNNSGSRHGNSKLTEKQVVRIRKEYAAGGVSYLGLSVKYGVGPVQIGMIIRRCSWTHI